MLVNVLLKKYLKQTDYQYVALVEVEIKSKWTEMSNL